MKLSHPLIMTGALVTLGGGLYAVIPYIESNANTSSPIMETGGYDRHPDSGGEESRTLAVLKEDLGRLETQVGNLRSEITTLATRYEDFDHLREEIATLREQITDVSNQAATAASSHRYDSVNNPATAGDSAAFMPANEYDMEAIAQEQEYQDLERIRHLEARFQAEPVDSTWSYTTTDTIVQAFQSENSSSSNLLGAECRSDLCRVQVDHADPEAINEFELWFPIMMADVLPYMTLHHEHHGNGRVTSTLYLGREGLY